MTEVLFPDADVFEGMVLLTAGGAPSDDVRDALDALGLTHNGAAVPEIREVLDPVLAPICQFRLVPSGAEAQVLHQGWMNGEVTSVLTQGDEDECLLRWVPTSFATTAIARLVALGPRRRRFEGRVPLSEENDLWSEHPRVRQVAARMLAEQAGPATPMHAALTGGQWTAWALEFAWPYVDESLGLRRLAVLDTPDVMAMLDDGELTCTDASAVWRLLQRMLPEDSELAPGLSRTMMPANRGPR